MWKPLRAFVFWYLRLKPWERSGRIYEILGFAALDKSLAAAFGEKQFQRWKPGDTLSKDRVLDVLLRGRYSETVNAMCTLYYVVFAILAWDVGQPWLIWWSLFIMLFHIVVIPIERYKRSLIFEWLEHPESLTDEPIHDGERRTPEQLQHWYYAPKSWESEKLYTRLGVNSMRWFVEVLSYVSEFEPDFGDREPNKIRSSSLEYLDAFERNTRYSELIHLVGILQHIPYYIVFIPRGYIPGILFCLYLLWQNLFAVYLQRQHRLRIFRLLMRRPKASTVKTQNA